ncbi:Putative CRISPR-associated helicase, Cas3 [Nitrosotalea sinensis]|uniref:CRISPR-associated helicase, Cas3 n=1 Tax=Nitrosotalea sinensis TaxID=1499975 RepID=A0A2H1EJA8_9ARCH|nr:hypothetical protein [Candidatus Nitrosotalea sinensis]SHO47622.1 Putative CRISPR-associated helicase, Cas3 [Candidatus Nitrosotalea sinensis]
MIIEGIILIIKLLSGKGVIGSISGASAGTAASTIAKSTIFAKSGLTGEIGSNAIGIGIGEKVGNSIEQYRERRKSFYSKWPKSQREFEKRNKEEGKRLEKSMKAMEKNREKRNKEEGKRLEKSMKAMEKNREKRNKEEGKRLKKLMSA